MITDLVRNDLGVVAVTGSVDVPELCAVEAHPGLVHLVSTVTAKLRPRSAASAEETLRSKRLAFAMPHATFSPPSSLA